MAYDVAHVPIATLPGMAERTLTISSCGKTFSFTGWKIGWATGPAPLVRAVLMAKQFMTFVSGAPFQPAIAHGAAAAGLVLRRSCAARCRASATSCATGWPRSASRCSVPQAPTSSPSTYAHSARRRRGVLPRPAARGAGSSRSRTRCSTTTWRPAGRWSGSRSASATRCSTRRCRACAPSSPDRSPSRNRPRSPCLRTLRYACTHGDRGCSPGERGRFPRPAGRRSARSAGAAAAADPASDPVERPDRHVPRQGDDRLVLGSRHAHVMATAQVAQRVVDDLRGVEPEPVGCPGHVLAGPLVELRVGEARGRAP